MDNIFSVKQALPALLAWYTAHERPLPWRVDATPYHVWVSEIMLQQTRIEAVIPHYHAFLQKIPDVTALAEISEEDLLKCWEGLGYYSRARNLQKAAKQLVAQGRTDLPQTYDELRKLAGIGEYTAGAIASICFGEAVPAVDGNVMRVLARLTADDTDVLSAQGKKRFTALAQSLVPANGAGQFNQAVMELGETVCLPNTMPLCEKCPLSDVCAAHKKGIERDLPVRRKLKSRKIEKRTVFVLKNDQAQILLHKRPSKGLLAGLYEFPNVQGALDAEIALNFLNDNGLTVYRLTPIDPARHIFTHIEWIMNGYAADVTGELPEDAYIWVDKDALQTQYALPSAFRSFLKYL